MAVTDPIADMLARIRNAHGAFHKKVAIPFSRMKLALSGILKAEGFIEDSVVKDKEIEITLKYHKGKGLISGLRRISTPGRRVYVTAHDIPKVQNGLGVCILSTSSGVVAGEEARARKIGGELLCEVW